MKESLVLIKRWGQAIQAGQLDNIANEIEGNFRSNSAVEVNNAFAKLLIHICHAVDRDKTKTALDIFNLAEVICTKLISIPDFTKFFSALYHIVKYLIEMKLYTEAISICNHIMPGSLFSDTYDDDLTKVYGKFSCLWYFAIEKRFTKLEKLDNTKYEKLLTIVMFELKLQTLSCYDGSKFLLTKLMAYFEKFNNFNQVDYLIKFNNASMEFLEKTTITLGVENKFPTYRYVLSMINYYLEGQLTLNNLNTLEDRIERIFNIFTNCMAHDRESRSCFKLYKQFCTLFIRRLDNFTSTIHEEMLLFISNLNAVTKKYGYGGAVKWNSYAMVKLIEIMLVFWDKCLRVDGNKANIMDCTIANIIDVLRSLSEVFSRIELLECFCKKDDCRTKFDIYYEAVIKSKAFNIMSRYYTGELTTDLAVRVIEIAEDCSQVIFYLNQANCPRWTRIWYTVASYMYNTGVRYEKRNYETAIHLYSLLAEGTIQLKAYDSELSYIKFDNPLNVALHRLSTTHFHHGKYSDAMITCSLYAYLDYKNENSKAFRMWTNIKYKYPKSHGQTIYDCLKTNKHIVEQLGVKINFQDCDLGLLCLRELRGLQVADIFQAPSMKAVLELIDNLGLSPTIYAYGVHLLAYHLLHYDSILSLTDEITRAQSGLKKLAEKPVNYHVLRGHLKFYGFIERLKQIKKTVETEMKSAKTRLVASDDSCLTDDPASDVVPAYSLIHIDTAADLASNLEKILDIWNNCLQNDKVIPNDWLDREMIVHTVIIAAEYTRFYRFHKFERKAWNIAYDLAEKFDDRRAIVWITGRCVLSRHINNEWIEKANDYFDELKGSTDHRTTETLAMFKLSLSEYYYQTGLVDEAKNLFDQGMSMPKIEFTQNLPTYLLSADIVLAYKSNFEENRDILEYIRTIIKGLYTMLTIDELGSTTWQPREQRLYAFDILFKFTNHVVIRMNSLLSYREITAHLLRRLHIVQKLCSPLHVAECLKNLCFIDLSRGLLDDCEVKIQGIEHILKIETFDISMQSELSPVTNQVLCLSEISPVRHMETVRDIPHNDTSPVLRKKVFIVPNFMSHNVNCKCFHCWNFAYQQLVFSCTHIRAQLYASQNHVSQALDHFYGAFNIIRKLIDFSNKQLGVHDSYHDVVEYVLFILDFARFLRHSVSSCTHEGLNMALHGLEVCENYKLTNHPIYFAVSEFIFDCRFENVIGPEQFSTFMVPELSDVDDSRYSNTVTHRNSVCETPARIIETTAAKSVRRRKTPPLLKLTQAVVDEVVDNDTITMSSLKSVIDEIAVKKKTIKMRPIRRKISSEYNENPDEIKSSTSVGEKDKTSEPSTSADESSDCSDSSTTSKKSSSSQKQRNPRTGSRYKRIIQLNSSVDSETESIDSVTDQLKAIKVSQTNSSKSSTEKSQVKSVDNKSTSLHRNGKSTEQISKTGEKENQVDNNSTPATTVINKSSRGRKKSAEEDTKSLRKSILKTPLRTSSQMNKSSESKSDDEVVECSIIELRRSRRVAKQVTFDTTT